MSLPTPDSGSYSHPARTLSAPPPCQAEVVTKDQYEGGLREILNFGHSVGHAVEHLTGMPHGLAVSIGMVKEAELARFLGHLASASLSRLTRLLALCELPVGMPALGTEDILRVMSVDKKNKVTPPTSEHSFVLQAWGCPCCVVPAVLHAMTTL